MTARMYGPAEAYLGVWRGLPGSALGRGVRFELLTVNDYKGTYSYRLLDSPGLDEVEHAADWPILRKLFDSGTSYARDFPTPPYDLERMCT